MNFDGNPWGIHGESMGIHGNPWGIHGNPRNHLPRDTAMALMDHLKSLDSERQKAQRYARELHLDLVSAMVNLQILGKN